jgi:hypothetical protein
MAHPERIAGLIFQNFTTSVEAWNPERLKVYERLGGPETPEKLAETIAIRIPIGPPMSCKHKMSGPGARWAMNASMTVATSSKVGRRTVGAGASLNPMPG